MSSAMNGCEWMSGDFIEAPPPPPPLPLPPLPLPPSGNPVRT